MYTRDHFVYALKQWKTTLQCDVVSDWLGAPTERSLAHGVGINSDTDYEYKANSNIDKTSMGQNIRIHI